MIAIGIMSGTSLDGIDLCLVEIKHQKFKQLAFKSYPYDEKLIEKIKEASFLETSNVQKICSLNFEIADAYTKAIDKFTNEYHFEMKDVSYIAMHGQTIWHNPDKLDGYYSSTLQIGEPAILAYKYNKMVISNFRVMDMAAGGSGAPLIPYIDYLLYHNKQKNIAMQNIGGIGNVCYLPKNGNIDDIIAFDTGPGNMLIDAAMQKLFNLPYDENGKFAKIGKINEKVLKILLDDEYLTKPLPKSTGREKYSLAYLDYIIDLFKEENQNLDNQKYDIIATITAYTAFSIIKEYELFLPSIDEIIVSGGGAHNEFIMELLQKHLKANVKIMPNMDGFEAYGFAILGYMTINKIPSNVPSVTGAKTKVILGNITNPPLPNKKF